MTELLQSHHSNRLDNESHRDLKVLEAIAEDGQITQRGLSSRLGIALGLTNLYLKRLVRKGYVKCVSVRANRLRYLLTPKGIAEKTRLTYEFIDYSLYLYRQVRHHLREAMQPIAAGNGARVAICGTGEAAELAYLSLKELNIEPSAILDGEGTATRFLGMPVSGVQSASLDHYDIIVVATLDRPDAIIAGLVERGFPANHIVTLRRQLAPRPNGPRTGNR